MLIVCEFPDVLSASLQPLILCWSPFTTCILVGGLLPREIGLTISLMNFGKRLNVLPDVLVDLALGASPLCPRLRASLCAALTFSPLSMYQAILRVSVLV